MEYIRILIINQHIEDFIGGSEIQCDLLAKYLTNYGHDVIYCAINSLNNIYSTNYRVIPLKNISTFALKYVLNDVNPDIIYWRFNRNKLLSIGFLSKYYQCKLIFSISSVNDTKKWGSIQHNFKTGNCLKRIISKTGFYITVIQKRVDFFGYYFVDGLVSLSQNLLQAMPLEGNLTKRICIYNSMESTSDDIFEWKRPYVVWVANLKKGKNPELFIKAAKKFEDSSVDFLLIGKIQDDSYAYIEKRFNLPKNCYYLGIKNYREVNSIIRKSLFVAHTCNEEGFGNIFIQAWLQGKPTVSLFFDPDGLIQKYEIGYLSGNFIMFCNDIDSLIKNEKLRQEMGSRAQSIALNLFDPERNMKRYESFFEEVLGK